MSDDEVDHDLLEFMRAHMNGNGHSNGVPESTGVLESAELIYDVPFPEFLEPNFKNALDVAISRDGCISAAEKVF